MMQHYKSYLDILMLSNNEEVKCNDRELNTIDMNLLANNYNDIERLCGRIFKSIHNNNEIFLPANKLFINDKDLHGEYWTSTIASMHHRDWYEKIEANFCELKDCDICAWALHFFKGKNILSVITDIQKEDIKIKTCDRYIEKMIRPIITK